MPASEPTLEHLSNILEEARARVWTPRGQRQPGSTDADYFEWIKAWQRVQEAQAKRRRRFTVKP